MCIVYFKFWLILVRQETLPTFMADRNKDIQKSLKTFNYCKCLYVSMCEVTVVVINIVNISELYIVNIGELSILSSLMFSPLHCIYACESI